MIFEASVDSMNKFKDVTSEYLKARRKDSTLNFELFDFEAVSYKESRQSRRKEAAKKRRIPIRKIVRKPLTTRKGSRYWIKCENVF